MSKNFTVNLQSFFAMHVATYMSKDWYTFAGYIIQDLVHTVFTIFPPRLIFEKRIMTLQTYANKIDPLRSFKI